MKLRPAGRGRGYSAWRALLESVLGLAYRGDWPARLWSAVPRADAVAVTRCRLTLPAKGSEPCRLAFVSDLHVGPTTPVPLLERTFEIIRRERADVLLLGGDYVYLEAEPRRLEVLTRLVESAACPVKIAVLGNHDLWTRKESIARALASAGVRVLINEVTSLPAPWTDVAVVGLDDPWAGRCDGVAAAAQLDGQPFRIVLCHSPDGLGFLSDLRFDLFLAGHTHGGQIAAPWGPIVLPHGRLCRQYPAGFAPHPSGVVFVSRGIGTVELPIRTFASPEVVVVDLLRPASAGPGAAKRSQARLSQSSQ